MRSLPQILPHSFFKPELAHLILPLLRRKLVRKRAPASPDGNFCSTQCSSLSKSAQQPEACMVPDRSGWHQLDKPVGVTYEVAPVQSAPKPKTRLMDLCVRKCMLYIGQNSLCLVSSGSQRTSMLV